MKDFDLNPLKKLLHSVIKLSKADIDKRFTRKNIGITPFQYGVLIATSNEPITINDIARHFNFKAPSIVPAVDTLQKAGLLERKPDTHDRRKTLLTVTKKGQDLLKRVPFDNKDDALNTAFKKLGPTKQKQLLNLLQELIINFPQ